MHAKMYQNWEKKLKNSNSYDKLKYAPKYTPPKAKVVTVDRYETRTADLNHKAEILVLSLSISRNISSAKHKFKWYNYSCSRPGAVRVVHMLYFWNTGHRWRQTVKYIAYDYRANDITYMIRKLNLNMRNIVLNYTIGFIWK